MPSPLPERSQHPAAPDGQRTAQADESARKLLAAIEEAMATPTSHRDDSPLPAVGSAPPVPQPGHPPMSQQQTDIGRTALYCGVATVPPGLVAALLMLASGQADPTVIGMVVAAPAALAVPILAVAKLLRGAKPDPEVHHHYNGHVDQRTVHTSTRGVWAKTDNREV
ncbi:hypothetical protein OG897_13525 [Streptomyces sp. NBC_00237]|uniref:hypothetical protein n=1 Tax=Streptomyces sp. NBC_00237 TaxID=2975687 RepID=UPI00225BEDDC|nr:hypothetical protein [Streptomyces sp. NBC_00237]MCX5202464.1 hypothetical protein [Streptomyces sp. NBC_00237]